MYLFIDPCFLIEACVVVQLGEEARMYVILGSLKANGTVPGTQRCGLKYSQPPPNAPRQSGSLVIRCEIACNKCALYMLSAFTIRIPVEMSGLKVSKVCLNAPPYPDGGLLSVVFSEPACKTCSHVVAHS